MSQCPVPNYLSVVDSHCLVQFPVMPITVLAAVNVLLRDFHSGYMSLNASALSSDSAALDSAIRLM